MKNLLSRDEYLVNEGFIKDTVKKGIDKVKSLFKIGMKKIKDFIAIFDDKGNVFPVVTIQTIIDKFSNSDAVKVYAPAIISQSAVDAGGNGCDDKAPLKDDVDDDFGPDGKEFAKWIKDKKYEETIEYKNLMSIPRLIKEHYDCTDSEAQKIFEEFIDESWDGVVKARIPYKDKKELSGIASINTVEFESILDGLIKDWSINDGKTRVRGDGKIAKPKRNVLIFGAPGIGKSTVPNVIIDKFNEHKDSPEMISLISVNCALIQEGDFMMPTMPKESDVIAATKKFADAFPKSKEYLDGLTPEQEMSIAQTISNSGQFKSTDAPKSWLPSYKPTGDGNIDELLNEYANGGIYTDEEGKTHKTGGGGIILFDEFLRADAEVFSQLMNFFLERRLQDWKLGSKWCIIACSNRPCDDGEVEKVWKDWNDAPASKSRQERMFQLIPDPELWSKWARNKGCDELLLKFIFDKNSMSGDEYPRWHSAVRRGTGDSKQVIPIFPRTWESAFNSINDFEIDNDLDDISQMNMSDIRDCFKGYFDEEFVTEIIDWLEDNMNKVELDDIINDPQGTYLPKKFVGRDQAKAGILVHSLSEQFEEKFKEHPEECTDDALANIIMWFGINYKGDITTFNTDFFQKLESILPDKEVNKDLCLQAHIKSLQMLYAAWPFKDINNDITDFEQIEDDKLKWPENSLETIKDLMRKYFPWRIDGDEIKFYDGLETNENGEE